MASFALPVRAASLGAARLKNRKATSHEPRTIEAPRLHAGAALLLFGMTFKRKRNQPVDQRREGESAGGPHLRVHADRREAGNGVHFVHVEDAAVAGEQKVDA